MFKIQSYLQSDFDQEEGNEIDDDEGNDFDLEEGNEIPEEEGNRRRTTLVA